MIVFLIIFDVAVFLFLLISLQTDRQIEYLLTHIKERLNHMPSKADLEAKIAELQSSIDAAFQALTDTLTAEIQQVKDAIAAGGDTAATIAALDTLESNLKSKADGLSSAISDIVTP